MKVTYDKSADAAYIYLAPPDTIAEKTYPCDPIAIDGMINLDFDKSGRLIGIEVLDASKKLSQDMLNEQETIVALNNALNEVLNGPNAIEDPEFQTRIGINREEAEKLLRKLQE